MVHSHELDEHKLTKAIRAGPIITRSANCEVGLTHDIHTSLVKRRRSHFIAGDAYEIDAAFSLSPNPEVDENQVV